jgi:hypothetical protein
VALVLALFAVAWVLAATWHSWQGGWSWGPRLVIPGVVVALALTAPWIGTHAARLKLAALLFAAGFVVSLPAVLAPAGLQQLDRGSSDGPEVVRQYERLPELARRSARAGRGTAARTGDYRRYLALWQAGIVREFGPWGLLPALLGSVLLLAALVLVARPLGPRLRLR